MTKRDGLPHKAEHSAAAKARRAWKTPELHFVAAKDAESKLVSTNEFASFGPS